MFFLNALDAGKFYYPRAGACDQPTPPLQHHNAGLLGRAIVLRDEKPAQIRCQRTIFLVGRAFMVARKLCTFILAAMIGSAPCASFGQQLRSSTAIAPTTATLWIEPRDIKTRSLYYGPGGAESQPRGPLTFVKEDDAGTSPKFDVEDGDGTKWKAKLGPEAQPETVATRLLWAVGFFAN